MAKRDITVKRRQHTITVTVDSYMETFTTEHLTRYQIIDRVRWIIITCGVSVEEDRVREILHELEI